MVYQNSLDMLSSINSNGNNYFHEACQDGSISLIQESERFVADVDLPFVRHLLRQKNFDGLTCIHVTMKTQVGPFAAAIIECLVRMGADLNATEGHGGDTALHLAARKQDHYMVEWLCMQPTININAVNYAMKTPYQIAKRNHDRKMMFILLTCGANTDVSSDSSSDETESDSSA